MEQDFYKGRLRDRHGLQVLVPGRADRELVHRVIFDELCLGETRADSRLEYLRIIDGLAQRGADAVVLGCTEIAMLVSQADTGVKLIDTTAVHAQKAVQLALADG